MSDYYGIRHAPGTCCPDHDCTHGIRPGGYTGKVCRECGADCSKCSHDPLKNNPAERDKAALLDRIRATDARPLLRDLMGGDPHE